MNNANEVGDLFPEFFSKLNSAKTSAEASKTVDNDSKPKLKGRMTAEGWKSFKEIDELKRLAKLEAQELFRIATSIQNVDQADGVISYRPTMADFKKENKVSHEFRQNNKTVHHLIDGTKLRFPMATQRELEAFEAGQPLPDFSLLE